MAEQRENSQSLELITAPAIQQRILFVSERHVMLDEDLAQLYGVETRRLIEQVKRDIDRFPADFMFQLSREAAAALRSQSATSNQGRGGRRYAPYVFTEQGVAMLRCAEEQARRRREHRDHARVRRDAEGSSLVRRDGTTAPATAASYPAPKRPAVMY